MVVQKEIKISVKAVLAGGAADLLSTIVMFSILSTYIVLNNGFTEERPEILAPLISNIIHKSPVLFGLQTAIGLICSIFGGYIAARVAKQDEIENAIAASLIFVAFGVYSLIIGVTDSVWLSAFSTLITPFFYRMGAQVRVKQTTARS